MKSTRPYLIRAMHEWASDNGLTPQLLVRVDSPEVEVPTGFVKDGLIVLNVSYAAVQGLELGNDYIQFNARFNGAPFAVRLPVSNVSAIFTRESGEGMSFETEPGESPPPTGTDPSDPKGNSEAAEPSERAATTERKAGRPTLKVGK